MIVVYSICVKINLYIHNSPLPTFSQDYGLASYTTYVVCVNFMPEWRNLQFNGRFLRNFFMAGLFTLRAFARNLLRGSPRRNIFFFFFFDDWPGIRTQAFASNKPTQYILDHGDHGEDKFELENPRRNP